MKTTHLPSFYFSLFIIVYCVVNLTVVTVSNFYEDKNKNIVLEAAVNRQFA